jgi:hypothetical protein
MGQISRLRLQVGKGTAAEGGQAEGRDGVSPLRERRVRWVGFSVGQAENFPEETKVNYPTLAQPALTVGFR